MHLVFLCFSDNNVDGLQFTKAWLGRNFLVLQKKQEEAGTSSSEGATSSSGAEATAASGGMGPSSGAKPVSPTALLNEAYLELLQWDFEHQIFPEVCMYKHMFL